MKKNYNNHIGPKIEEIFPIDFVSWSLLLLLIIYGILQHRHAILTCNLAKLTKLEVKHTTCINKKKSMTKIN